MGNEELEKMITHLRFAGYLTSKDIETAMLLVDRRFFVPEKLKQSAYDDCALPVGYGQTISAPNVVAFMLEKLGVKKGMSVLEIGTGSGYNTALLAEIVGLKGKVTSIEVVQELSKLANENIKKSGKNYKNIFLIVSDGSEGYLPNAPYDAIVVTAAMPWLDENHHLIKQLKPNGKLIAPVGDRYFQNLILYNKNIGTFEKVLPVIFVPLLGKYGFKRE